MRASLGRCFATVRSIRAKAQQKPTLVLRLHRTITSVTSFSANYKRFTPEVTDLLMRIPNALGSIRGARVLPAVADQLRASARAGTVHYSNLIEGNELPFVEAERAARGELPADTKAKIELVDYVAALDLIDDRLASGGIEMTSEFLKELHGVTTKGLGRPESRHFKPHHEGEWRDGSAPARVPPLRLRSSTAKRSALSAKVRVQLPRGPGG